MMKKLGRQTALFLLSMGLFIGAQAQSSTVGNISGTVRDPQGAAIPNAEVVIQEETTGASRTVVTNDTGFFSAPSLPVGLYSVSTAPQGFKKTISGGLELNVAENAVINLTLEVGAVNEVITVTADEQQIETRSGKVSSLIDEKQVTELPLNGRNFAQLALLVPGVSPVTQSGAGGAFRTGGTGLDSGVDISVNGNASNQNLWTVDGVNNMDVGSNRTLLIFPSIDSIQEFRVERNSFSAEYGQAQGAVINLITKGGGNQFHGTAFEFLRNDVLNSNDFFLNRNGQPKGKLRYNNFGFNLNGPVYLPRFGEGGKPYISGKNRLFFFWSEEFRRERRGQVLTGRVPTAAEKVGDFSGALTGQLPHIPGGVCNPNGTPPNVSGCFPGNRIPANMLSPAGLALLRIYPDPNSPNPTSGQNFAAAPLQPVNTRQDSIRLDANITEKMNLLFKYTNETFTHGSASGNFWGDTPFPTLSSDWDQPSRSLAVKLSNTLNSTTVNEFQFSRAGNDIFIGNSPQSEALVQDITSKFPTVFPGNNNFVPGLFWGPGGYDTLWHQAPWQNHQDLFIWKDDLSKVVGNNELKFGVLFSHNIKNEQGNGAGGSNVPSFITGCGTKTGNCIADLLLRDLPLTNYAEVDHIEYVQGRWHDFEVYANDSWRVRPTVTLNFGLRYSRFPQAYSDNDRISNFIPRLYNGTDYLSGLVTPDEAGQLGLPRSLVKTYTMGFQPRVGLAWDIKGNGKTALRMGFGRYLSRSNVIEDVNRMAANPPWVRTVDSGWSGATETLADSPIRRSLDTINPGLINSVAGVNPAAGFNGVNEDFQPPESYQWNLTVSRELMKNTIMEASYVGNRGLHIWRRNVNVNDVAPGAGRLAIANAVRNGQDTTQLFADNRVLRGVGPIAQSQSTGNSSYHGLQIQLNRRFSNRLSYAAAYTWGHAISDVPLTSFTNSTTDPFNFALDRGDSDLDRRHTFTGNAVYALPSFRSLGAFGSKILGDWQINGIFSYYGATPIDVISGANTLGTAGNVNARPDLVPGVPIYLNTNDPTQHLNPAAFALPALGQFGNLGRGAIRGKPINNLDFSFAKNWIVRERVNIQFRTELFNALNHPNFVGFNTALNLDPRAINADGTANPTFGRSTNGSFGALTNVQSHREIQFGLKFGF